MVLPYPWHGEDFNPNRIKLFSPFYVWKNSATKILNDLRVLIVSLGRVSLRLVFYGMSWPVITLNTGTDVDYVLDLFPFYTQLFDRNGFWSFNLYFTFFKYHFLIPCGTHKVSIESTECSEGPSRDIILPLHMAIIKYFVYFWDLRKG